MNIHNFIFATHLALTDSSNSWSWVPQILARQWINFIKTTFNSLYLTDIATVLGNFEQNWYACSSIPRKAGNKVRQNDKSLEWKHFACLFANDWADKLCLFMDSQRKWAAVELTQIAKLMIFFGTVGKGGGERREEEFRADQAKLRDWQDFLMGGGRTSKITSLFEYNDCTCLV